MKEKDVCLESVERPSRAEPNSVNDQSKELEELRVN